MSAVQAATYICIKYGLLNKNVYVVKDADMIGQTVVLREVTMCNSVTSILKNFLCSRQRD